MKQKQQTPIFVAGRKAAFFYNGQVRVGVVEKVTEKTVTMWDYGRNDYRSFSLAKVNRDA